MPPNTQTSTDSLPELDNSAELVWRKELNLVAGKKISNDVRLKLIDLLGKEQVDKIPNKPEAYIVQNIFSQLATTRKRVSQIVDINEAPNAKIVDPAGKEQKLSSLITNPNSREAQALVWMFKNFDGDKKKRAKYFEIFKQMTPEEIQDIRSLDQMKEIHEKITKDRKYQNIGKAGTMNVTTPPFTVTHEEGKIGSLQRSIIQQREAMRTVPRTDLAKAEENIQKWTDKIAELEDDKAELKSSLDHLNSLYKELSTKPAPIAAADITTMSQDFGASSFVTAISGNDIEIQGNKQEVGKWMTKSNLKDLAERARFGAKAPTASTALDQLLKIEFEGNTQFMTKEQKDKYFSEMKKMLTEANESPAPSAPSAAPATPGTAPSTPDKKRSVFTRAAIGTADTLVGTPYRAARWTTGKAFNAAKQVLGWPLGIGSNKNPLTWPGKGVQAVVIGKGSNKNPLTWPAKTVKLMYQDKAWAAGTALGGTLAMAALGPLAIPAGIGLSALVTLVRKYNNAQNSPKP